MSIKIMSLVWELNLPTTQKMVLLALADNANDQGVCWPSISTLEVKTSLHRATVIRVIADLESDRHLTRSSETGKTNTYSIHPSHTATSRTEQPVAHGDPTSRTERLVPVAHGDPTRRTGRPRTIIEPSVEPSLNTQTRARGVDYEWFRTLKAAYPAGTYGQHHWQSAERAIRQLCENGQATPDDLLTAVSNFARQQTAMGRIGTQYVTSPNRFFEAGMWQGPFPLPKAAQKVQPEKPERVRFIPPEYRDEEAANVPS